MSEPVIGFYVHHHGQGHLDRTAAIVGALGPDRSHVATSHPQATAVLDESIVTTLPFDVADPTGPGRGLTEAGDVTAHGTLHWAPERPTVAVARIRAIADWLEATRPSLVVVDVSVEVAVQVRLMGVPVVVVRLPGRRDDPAHLLGYRLAEDVVAPFAEAFEPGGVPEDVRRRTFYAGHIAPAGGRTSPTAADGRRPRTVLVVWGRGSGPPAGADLDAAAAATPEWSWTMVGPPTPGRPSSRVEHLGWRQDVAELAATSSVVVGTAGDGTIALAAATRPGLVVIAQDRPFDEQRSAAAQLERLGLAVVEPSWPTPHRWPSVLDAATRLDPGRLDVLGVDGAAPRAAARILETAERCQARRREGSVLHRV